MKQVETGQGAVRVGTIAVIHGTLAIVDEINVRAPSNPIQYKHNTKHAGYICGPDEVQAVLGKVDIEAWNSSIENGNNPVTSQAGQSAIFGPMAGVKVDTPMVISGRRGQETVTYKGYKRSRPKYPISFERDGRPMKGPMTIVQKVTRDGKLVPLHEETGPISKIKVRTQV